MALHLFLYVFLFLNFEFLGGVAVVHCLRKKRKKKRKKRKCSVSEFTNISGMVEFK